MATGIVSLASHLRGVTQLAWGLFALNVVAYAILMALLLVRILRFGERVIDDLRDHRRGPGFFTVVASTCVLGSQSILILENVQIAWRRLRSFPSWSRSRTTSSISRCWPGR